MEEPQQYAYVRRAQEAGWQVGVHANGDVAIDQTLRVYERVQKEMDVKLGEWEKMQV